MSTQSELDRLEALASSAREQKRWAEARQRYEQMLGLDLIPIDRAKMLANIMQMLSKEGKDQDAIRIGEDALSLLQEHPACDTNEGAVLRGFIRGALRRMRGEPLAWHLPASLAATYFIGAAIGSLLGSTVQYEGLTIRGMTWTDFRYGGAGLGAVLGFLIFARPFLRLPVLLAVLGLIASLIGLCIVLTAHNVRLGVATLVILLLPVALVAWPGGIVRFYAQRVKE